jgi:hypothetical protein
MTPAQRIALARPVYLASECLHPRYRSMLTGSTSLVLTVNTGYE